MNSKSDLKAKTKSAINTTKLSKKKDLIAKSAVHAMSGALTAVGTVKRDRRTIEELHRDGDDGAGAADTDTDGGNNKRHKSSNE
jgi:hypothetical protein